MNDLPDSHPYWFLRDFVSRNAGDIYCLNLSHYSYIPKTLADGRRRYSITVEKFIDADYVKKLAAKTPLSKELSFHSTVLMNDGTDMHIPMVDMFTVSKAQLVKLEPYLGASLFKKFQWYKSGRSFHGYAATLISSREWVSFMGRLLLVNQPGFIPMVDPRWIGHRLIAGYSALRWTKNSAHYLQVPKKIEFSVKKKLPIDDI